MSEPLAERLSRFTPNGTALNRDALLFAAGRASVRPSRRWQALVGMLAASQLLTLVGLWPRVPLVPPKETPIVASEPPHRERPSMPPTEADPSALRTLRQQMLDADLDIYSTPPSDEPMAPQEPPLHAFGTPPRYLIN